MRTWFLHLGSTTAGLYCVQNIDLLYFTMRTSSLLYIFAFTSYVVAGDVDANDLPSQCQDVCAPVVSLTSSCDKKTNDDDTAELNCICKDSRAAKSLPDCDACISKYSKDGRDNGTYFLT